MDRQTVLDAYNAVRLAATAVNSARTALKTAERALSAAIAADRLAGGTIDRDSRSGLGRIVTLDGETL